MIKYLKIISKKITSVQAVLLLGIIYYLVLPIFWSIRPGKKSNTKPGWKKWHIKLDTLSDARKQY